MLSTKRTLFALAAAVTSLITVEAAAIIGRPLTPVSYAGAARRTVRRTAVAAPVVGAAAVGAAAVGTAAAVGHAAAVAALPHGCVAGVTCGGVVYEPVYSGGAVMYVPR